jgi:diguanylate cyclase (GGDEF)-like protein/PAS domain S-box-containing protein
VAKRVAAAHAVSGDSRVGLGLPEVACVACCPDGFVVGANVAAAALVGVPESADLLGRSLTDLLVEDGDAHLLRRADGSFVRVRVGRTPTVDGAADTTSVLFMPERQVEPNSLDRPPWIAPELFEDVQRVAMLGIWSWRSEPDSCAWSSMVYRLLGADPTETPGVALVLACVHPDDRDRVAAAWRALATQGDPDVAVCEFRVFRKNDRALRVLHARGSATRGPAGTTVVGTVQDVTERRITETKIRRSTQRFSDLVSITPVGIGLFDEKQCLVDANEALCALLGWDLDQLRGKMAAQLRHSADVSNEDTADDAKYRHLSAFMVGQHQLRTATGQPVFCELSATSTLTDDGRKFWLVVFQDVTERLRTAQLLRHQVRHDDLTGLPGRIVVQELLAELLGGAHPERVALLFCDVDNFKRVNDSLGHDAGDELLIALARRLEQGLPSGCTAARMSGDEYVVICEDTGAVGGVEALSNRVARLLRTAVPVQGQLLRVSASVGVSVPCGPGDSAADLLRFADAAVFEAKRRGAGRVAMANAALIASADSQMSMEGELREALAGDALVLHYQPVTGPDGAVVTAEALVRWPHPERGLLSPGEFLPIAEQGDLLRDLDRWVLRTALREARRWPEQVAVAINLSGLVPGDAEFVDVVADAVTESGVAWTRVVLELVETSLVDLPARSRVAMAELVSRGVRFAVDDFGTGYSSLARLKDLPAQIIKVDRRFVAGVGTDPSDFAVVRAVVDMARAMGRRCVAEGVETASQFTILRDVGVDAYQGWLLSRPIPEKDIRALLKLGAVRVPEM